MKITSAARSAAFVLALLVFGNCVSARAQERLRDEKNATAPSEEPAGAANSDAGGVSNPVSVEDRLRRLERIIEDQQREIQALRAVVGKGETAGSARQPAVAAEPLPRPVSRSVAVAARATEEVAARDDDAMQKRVDDLYKRFGSLRVSGDLRFRYETLRNQGFDALTDSPDRNRLRLRARLGLNGTLNSHFDWGVRVTTGNFVDPISSNQTLTDFFERKPIGLERAFVRYDSKGESMGVQLVAGKFTPTFRRTQMVWDDDVSVEGASEAVYFKTKTPLRQVRLVAFELPFNELAGGKDGVLYGGQVQSDWQISRTVSANANLAYYDWNHADQIVGALGALTTQVNGGIANTAGTTGGQNGALGTTNRLVRDADGQPIGFLAGFNLVDFLGNLTWQASRRFPVTFSVDYVHNATGRVRDEKNGYWTGIQVGQEKEKGDWLFGYTYTRIEQDAVLVPFNFSDILQSNSRVHMPTIGYQIANAVTVQWNGLFSQRVNPVTTNSPFNRYLNRMQFDVIYKF